MKIELIGVVTIVLGVLAMFAPTHRAFAIMVVSTLFGAAAAFSLSGLGGASVLVPNLFLAFYCLRLFMAFGEGPAISSFMISRSAFWLLLLTAYGLMTAFFFPRLMEGVTETMLVQRISAGRNFISLMPLEASTNNITQAVYALGGLLCFAFTFGYVRETRSAWRLVQVMLILSWVNLFVAVLDIATYYTGTAHIFDFVRTANYALLTGSEKAGFKRISGTFSEASAFAGYTAVLFAFVASLWLDRVRSWVTGLLASLLLAVLLLSTSATGMVALAAVVLFLGFRSAQGSIGRRPAGRPAFLASLLLVVPLVALFIVLAMPGMVEDVTGYLDEILFSKLESQSGRERSMWNAVAFQVFLDTRGLGAGLGSARASSYLFVLLSNVGLLGAILFFLFVGSIFLGRGSQQRVGVHTDDTVVRACKAALVANLAEALTSGTVYDLGLLFYLLAGTAAALQVPVRRSSVASKVGPRARPTPFAEAGR